MTNQEKTLIFKQKCSLRQQQVLFPNRELDIVEVSKDPSLFILRLGYSCNIRCIHCFIEDKRERVEDLSTEEIKLTIDSIQKKGAIITVTGGEPTVRPDLRELLKYMKEKGFLTSLETNGVKFADTDYLENLAPYLDSVFLPIHSFDPEIFDKITNLRGSWERVVKGVKNLIETDIYQMTITVINQFNYSSLVKTFDFIQDLLPGQLMSLTFPHAIGAAHSTTIVPRYSDVKEHVYTVLKKYSSLMYVHYLPKCIVFPYQDITVDLGNISRPGTDYIDDRWQKLDYSTPKIESRVKTSDCKQCIFDNECTGVWKEYSEIYPQSDLVPVKSAEL